MDVKSYLNDKKSVVDSFLAKYLENSFAPSVLSDAMKYSLLAGGKRLRPILCLSSYETCGGRGDDILPQACALELIHTYSLIHDDLPAMDNDDLRRGKPTNHVVFGEAMAILAGDALLTDAFRIFSDNTHIPSDRLIRGIQELSSSAGIMGMVAGQAQDILSERSEPDEETLQFIHLHKTGALIQCSVKIGGILSGADDATISCLEEYGRHIGLGFQIIDDILDIVGTTEALGKPAGSDEERLKMTYPSVFGLDTSKEKAGEHISTAIELIKRVNGNPDALINIAEYLLTRTS